MLLLIDQPRHIKVSRRTIDPAGNSSRVTLGRVEKATLEVPAELDQALLPEEKPALEEGIAFYREAQVTQRRAQALRFPEELREVAAWLETEATDAERKHVLAALSETFRRVLKDSGAETD